MTTETKIWLEVVGELFANIFIFVMIYVIIGGIIAGVVARITKNTDMDTFVCIAATWAFIIPVGIPIYCIDLLHRLFTNGISKND